MHGTMKIGVVKLMTNKTERASPARTMNRTHKYSTSLSMISMSYKKGNKEREIILSCSRSWYVSNVARGQ